MERLCDLCKTIQIDRLPHEEEIAIRHRTLLELERNDRQNSGRCEFCLVIYRAVGWWWQFVRDSTAESHKISGAEDDGGRILWDGAYVKTVPNYIEHDMRVWLFGNWWKLHDDEPRNQLLGLGVRLSKRSGHIKDADGRHKDSIVYRGTGVRVCTGFGKFIYCNIGLPVSHR